MIGKIWFSGRGCSLLALLVSLCLLSGALRAQNRPLEKAQQQRSEVLRDNQLGEESGEIVDEDAEEQNLGDDTPLGVNVTAIVLISHQDKASMSPGIDGEPIQIDPALPAPEGLNSVLEPYLGKPLSMALLGKLGSEIVLAWRESDYPLVDVYFPEQNITLGKIQVVVREAVLGEKREEGAVHSRPEYLLDNIRVNPGDRINRRVVQGDLDWLNENPIRQVNVIYERGTADGTSDIVVDVIEEDAVKAYAGFANTGLNLTGQNEWTFGLNLANPWKTEQSIGYQFTADEDFDSLNSHALFYQAFLPWRHTLSLIGAYVTSSAENSGLIGIEGENTQATAEYRIPLERPNWNRRLRHAVTTSFDYKSTNTDLLFGGINVFGTDISIGQFRFEYEADFPDKLGFNRFNVGLAVSPGNMYGGNDDASFMLARAGSMADYVYGFIEAEKIIRLPRDWSFRMKATGQVTDDRLPSTEQLLAGGYNTVRGYDESVTRSDSGLIVNLELISPEFSFFEVLEVEGDDAWNIFVFYDAAALELSDPLLTGESGPSLQSVGLGLQGRLADYGYVRASYGWTLAESGVDPVLINDGKFHFGLTVIY